MSARDDAVDEIIVYLGRPLRVSERLVAERIGIELDAVSEFSTLWCKGNSYQAVDLVERLKAFLDTVQHVSPAVSEILKPDPDLLSRARAQLETWQWIESQWLGSYKPRTLSKRCSASAGALLSDLSPRGPTGTAGGPFYSITTIIMAYVTGDVVKETQVARSCLEWLKSSKAKHLA